MALNPMKKKSGQDAADGSALVRAQASSDEGAVHAFVNRILSVGIDGAGPLDSAREVAEEALRETGGDVEQAVKKVARKHLVGGFVGGFVTGMGGFVTMPVALPVNVVEFYLQATRMVAGIAHLRGYDLTEPHVRTAVLLTLVGSDADDVLAKAGMASPTGKATSAALQSMPPAAMLLINKAIGFRLLRETGGRVFQRFGRGVPFLGGAVGGSIDGWMMKRIADQALQEFWPTDRG